MKRQILFFAAIGLMAMAGCTKEPEISASEDDAISSGEKTVLKFNVSDFPTYDDVSKAVGTEDPGKTAWADGDVILFSAGDARTEIIFDGTGWRAAEEIEAAGTVEVNAWYAPEYEWGTGATPVLKSGKQKGTDEFLHFSAQVDASEGVSIDFSQSRNYSRLRISDGPSVSLSLRGDFVPVNSDAALGTSAVSLVTDENGNAFVFGTWTANSGLQFIKAGMAMTRTLAAASENGHPYVFDASGIADEFTLFIDPRDGEEYRICRITNSADETTVWFADNLRAQEYSDGTPIEEMRFYGDNASDNASYLDMKEIYGGYYTWTAAVRDEMAAETGGPVQGACPDGWHVSTEDDWTFLINNCSDPTRPGVMFKNPGYWNYGDNGQNTDGMNIAGAGYIWQSEVAGTPELANGVNNPGTYTGFWKTKIYDGTQAYVQEFNHNNAVSSVWYYHKKRGFSVRCVLD